LIPGLEGICICPADEFEGDVVVMVRTLVTGEPLGVREAGTTEH
jgi:hypothetical protein